jgi:hypothetical protein
MDHEVLRAGAPGSTPMWGRGVRSSSGRRANSRGASAKRSRRAGLAVKNFNRASMVSLREVPQNRSCYSEVALTKTFLHANAPARKGPAMSARDIIEALEREAPLLDGPGDRFSGYAIMAVSFQSGHVLALRRFSASSIGPGYTAVWHRDPWGFWTFYSTVSPELSCARYFGGQVDRNVVTPIVITWVNPMRLRITVGAAIDWHVSLSTSLTTRLLNIVAGMIPERAWLSPTVLRFIGIAAKATLGTGRLNLTGLTPNGHRFIANPRRLWVSDSSHAVVEGVNVGPVGPLTNQAPLGDFLLPQRGLFVVARAHFEQPTSRSSRRPGRVGSCSFEGSPARRPNPSGT